MAQQTLADGDDTVSTTIEEPIFLNFEFGSLGFV
jgi:hypothetical protein